MAVRRRLPRAASVAHPDRGSRYASDHYRRLLGGHGITCSMGRRADCWDDAPMESSFASPKEELVHHEHIGCLEFPTKSGHGVKGYTDCSYSAGETYPSEE